jgi:transcriptional regulator
MHPNAAFRHDDRALLESLISEIGFGMVFATTPDGPRVAHVPLLWTGNGTVQFHLAGGNALTKHIDGIAALIVVNGPDSYVSPRYYENPAQVPTWNYLALELEGKVRGMDAKGLVAELEALTVRQEERIVAGKPWTMDKMPAELLRQMLTGITGFELEVQAWRPTFKLSQNKPADERARAAEGLEAEGSTAIAQLMRAFAQHGGNP